MKLWSHAKSLVSLVVITAQLMFWVLGLMLASLVKLLVPPLRSTANRSMDGMYRIAVAIDDAWLRGVLGIDWTRPPLGLDRGNTYVVLANHASWSDILLLQSVLVRDGPVLKFLVKRSLMWVPIFGVIFWAFDFPRLRRRARSGEDEIVRRRRDLDALRSACEVVRERPAALMVFAEGTRFTPEKRLDQDSPYRHLLEPRVGGLAALLEGLEGDIEAVLDVTIVYPRPVSFWSFLAGALATVEVDVERIEPDALPTEREALVDWLAERWRQKDARIEAARATGREGPG